MPPLDDDAPSAAQSDSRSLGSAHAGALQGAVRLPTHPGYAVRDASRAWATAETVGLVVSAFDQVLAMDPDAPKIRVHDLSLRHGGPMEGHKSHQSGRDVDLTYYQRQCEGECVARQISPADLDAARQWRLLRQWLERGAAEFIFVDYALQRPLYEQATYTGATSRQLEQWFQYPRGSDFPVGIIRHVPNHANHVHVRFRCEPRDSECRSTAARRILARGAMATSSLLELVEDESEDRELLEQLQD